MEQEDSNMFKYDFFKSKHSYKGHHTETGKTYSLVLGGLWGGAGEMQGGSKQIVLSSRRCFFSGIFSAASAGF